MSGHKLRSEPAAVHDPAFDGSGFTTRKEGGGALELAALLGATAYLLTTLGIFAKRALPPFTELLVAVLPLLSDRMNKRARRLIKANKQSE